MQYLSQLGIAPRGWATPSARTRGPPAGGDADEKHIYTNFLQYGFPLPEIVISDNARSPFRHPSSGWLDCIVTDPPYGVRAASKKQGREDGKTAEVKDAANYIPSKVGYGEDELNRDLLSMAAASLRDGGRMTFLVPVDLADFLGIDRAAERGAAGERGTLRDAAMPDQGRTHKDKRLIISETTRDPLLLDEKRLRR